MSDDIRYVVFDLESKKCRWNIKKQTSLDPQTWFGDATAEAMDFIEGRKYCKLLCGKRSNPIQHTV